MKVLIATIGTAEEVHAGDVDDLAGAVFAKTAERATPSSSWALCGV
jgi:hypothetical protein